MRHGSLFSGIGGFDLAAEWMGWENVFQVEKDSFCQKVLEKNFPNTKRYGDIKEFDGTKYRGAVDIISGGFPCQPFSVAGKRKGANDDRFLWPEMLRVIREVEPSYVVAENVTGIIDLALREVLVQMEKAGFQVQLLIIPACAVNAPHRRDRVWIVANAKGKRLPAGGIRCGDETNKPEPHDYFREFNRNPWANKPLVGGRIHGIPNRVDRVKALGNAIVPQVAYEIFKAINQISHDRNRPLLG